MQPAFTAKAPAAKIRFALEHARQEGREKQYVFDPHSLQSASAWIEMLGKQWDERLQRLKDLVEDDNVKP